MMGQERSFRAERSGRGGGVEGVWVAGEDVVRVVRVMSGGGSRDISVKSSFTENCGSVEEGCVDVGVEDGSLSRIMSCLSISQST